MLSKLSQILSRISLWSCWCKLSVYLLISTTGKGYRDNETSWTSSRWYNKYHHIHNIANRISDCWLFIKNRVWLEIKKQGVRYRSKSSGSFNLDKSSVGISPIPGKERISEIMDLSSYLGEPLSKITLDELISKHSIYGRIH